MWARSRCASARSAPSSPACACVPNNLAKQKLPPCGLHGVTQHKYEVRGIGLCTTRIEAYFCYRGPTVRLFHLATSSAQATASPSVESLEDKDDEAGVASVGVELEEQATKHEKSHQKIRPRDIFKIGIPKVNIQSAIETMRLARTHGLPSEEIILGSSPQPVKPMRFQIRHSDDERLAASMKTALEKTRQGVVMKAALYQRQRLPLMAEDAQEAVLRLVNDNDVAIILAKTGSGKTTQVPQILLDDMVSPIRSRISIAETHVSMAPFVERPEC